MDSDRGPWRYFAAASRTEARYANMESAKAAFMECILKKREAQQRQAAALVS